MQRILMTSILLATLLVPCAPAPAWNDRGHMIEAGIFHAFHHDWITDISRALNGGLLPAAYYALPEQIAGGLGPDVLPEMPLFLSADVYVPVPLEATYQTAWKGLPAYWREVLASTSSNGGS